MATEFANRRFGDIETWPVEEAVEAMVESQLAAVAAVKPLSSSIAAAASEAALRLKSKDDGRGRLVYVGAGTSGRIAAQDGVELQPTYNWPNHRLVYLLAGGPSALTESAEGAEDDAVAGAADVRALAPSSHDVVIGVAASGRTPYTIAALDAARATGALTIAVVNNRDTPLLDAADFGLVAETGGELVAGSTRMKAGTAQKVILNLLSTAIMMQLGRVHRGLMVNMIVSNIKLRKRGADIIHHISGLEPSAAARILVEADDHLPLAILMGFGLEKSEAADLLDRKAGHVGDAVRALDHTP